MTDEKVLLLFGSNNAKLRRKFGWTPAEFGERTGLGELKIGQFERGEVSAPLSDMRRLASVFGVPLSTLVGLAEASEPDEGQQ